MSSVNVSFTFPGTADGFARRAIVGVAAGIAAGRTVTRPMSRDAARASCSDESADRSRVATRAVLSSYAAAARGVEPERRRHRAHPRISSAITASRFTPSRIASAASRPGMSNVIVSFTFPGAADGFARRAIAPLAICSGLGMALARGFAGEGDDALLKGIEVSPSGKCPCSPRKRARSS